MDKTLPFDYKATGVMPLDFEAVTIDRDKGTFKGIAVPWMKPSKINNLYYEQFKPGSIKPKPGNSIKLMSRHKDLIGVITHYEDRPAGWYVEGKTSNTTLGRESMELVADGAFDGLSIGIDPNLEIIAQYDEKTKTVTVESLFVREVSFAAFPKLEGTAILEAVREDINIEETPAMDTENLDTEADKATDPVNPEQGQTDGDNITREDLNALQNDMLRKLAVANSQASTPAAPAFLRENTVGDFVLAVAAGNEDYLREYNALVSGESELLKRSYAGGTSEDSVLVNTWVGDIGKIVNPKLGLRGFFKSSTPPANGTTLEWAKIASNTIEAITDAHLRQDNEGDDLAMGKVTYTTETTTLNTYGIYSAVSMQQAKKSNVNILNTIFNAQARRLAKRLNDLVREEFYSVFDAQVTASASVTVDDPTDYKDWLDAYVDAADQAEEEGYPIEALLVDKATFKALGKLEGTDGRPLVLITGEGNNNVGTFNTSGLRASLFGLTVIADPRLAHDDGASPTPNAIQLAAFANSEAINFYSDPVVRLEDTNIRNITREFSIHTMAATAAEVPQAIIPVEL